MNKEKIFRVIDFMKMVDSKQTTLEGENAPDAKAKNYEKPKPIVTERDRLNMALREASDQRVESEKRGEKPKEKKLELF